MELGDISLHSRIGSMELNCADTCQSQDLSLIGNLGTLSPLHR
jgi:hypothetical protein